uniref:Retrovirus-related Pol polyprotein from transposon TNT 1-94-like beta-barrel domain-containing protein n=1 Tax=Manihot esculenta TaxID=3983 RepID=A0A2C9UA31_MANES
MEEVNVKLELLQQEMSRLIKGKVVVMINTVNSHSTYSYHPTDCSGDNLSLFHFNHKVSFSVFAYCSMITGIEAWIIDTDASNHVTTYRRHMISIHYVSALATMHLPNGSSTQVLHTETVALHTHMKLIDVLLVPDFTMNLLSMFILLKHISLTVQFY